MAINAQLPLLGVIMCCTSIPPEQRSELASIAEQMGAVHKFDLTSDVTHLVVGDYDTPKYKFVAKERLDVKVMLPSWIEAVRASWLEAESTDVEAAELKHKLPTYHGLRICVTGFDDLAYRKQLEDEIITAGGQYSGNLTKDITHLVAKKPGSEKYEYAKHKQIKTVSIEWHEQSLQRGMILDEALYHPSLPVSERGHGAWIRKTVSTTSLGKRTRESDGGSQNARKLRRTASAKFETHNDSLWTDIVGAEVKIGEVRAEEWDSNAQPNEHRDLADKALEVGGAMGKILRAEDDRQTRKRNHSFGSLELLLGKPPQREALFQDATFLLQGFDEKRASILAKHLLSHGASLISPPSELPISKGYLLVPHTTHNCDASQSLKGVNPIQVVTDLWIERCLHTKQLLDPHDNITSTPFEHFPVTGFEMLSVSSTGFQGIDLLHASKVVMLLGGSYHEYFTQKATVLVCNNVPPGHEKLRHAQLWRVPAVKAEWLWNCIREGKKLSFEDYLVQSIGLSGTSTGSSNMLGEVVTTRRSDPKPYTNGKPSEKPAGKATSSREQFQPPRKGSRELKSSQSVGKSLLTNSFPDDAGPLLLPDEAVPHTDHALITADYEKSPPRPSEEKRAPLQEISPNPSPPKAKAQTQALVLPQHKTTTTQPPKHPAPIPEDDEAHSSPLDSETLGPAISSLLSHHQAARSSNPTVATAPNPSQPLARLRPRRRQLLGRAPSNLSSSHHSITLSRASSVDTLNTDGLGTPLEAGPLHPQHSLSRSSTITNHTATIPKTEKPAAAKPEDEDSKAIYDHDYDHDPDRPTDDHLQMTQLGYEDPSAAAWRERVALKMAAGGGGSGVAKAKIKAKAPAGTGTPGKHVVIVVDGERQHYQDEKEARAGSELGIAKRTRGAVGALGRR